MQRRRPTTDDVIRDYLLPYKEEHGDLLVPNSYKAPDGFGVGEWVKKRRHAKTKGTLPTDQVEALDTVGFVWDVHGLHTWKHAALAFFRAYGHLDVPQGHVTDDGVPLGKRVNGARDGLRRGTLDPQVKAFLDGLDPDWVAEDRRDDVRSCAEAGCEGVHYAKGLCRKHYNQARKQ